MASTTPTTPTTAGHSVTVSGLNTTTTVPTLDHFFSFCGKISNIAQEGDTAKVTFVKESAAKTALMLSGGHLDGNTITVTSETVEAPAVASATKPVAPEPAATTTEKDEEIEQEDKPRAAILAEYLAHGYMLSDTVIERAIAVDQQHGISGRFLSYFNPLATKVQSVAQPHVDRASAKLAEVDEKQGLSLKASAASIIGSKYYSAALSSPFGSKVHSFYTQAAKQVNDVHEEALRIKESKKASATAPTPTSGTAAPADTTSTTPLETTSAPIVKE